MEKRSDPNDPRGLIFEAFRMPGISVEECRSIFFDWALGLPADIDSRVAAQALFARYHAVKPDHPMVDVLREAEGQLLPPEGLRRNRRRGGRG